MSWIIFLVQLIQIFSRKHGGKYLTSSELLRDRFIGHSMKKINSYFSISVKISGYWKYSPLVHSKSTISPKECILFLQIHPVMDVDINNDQ